MLSKITINEDPERPEIIISHIPRSKNVKNQAKLEAQLDQITVNPPPMCYYCDLENFENRSGYQKHVLNSHPRKLAYPGKIELKLFGLQVQHMPWEI